MEKVARMLCVNSPQELHGMQEIFVRICANALEHPHEEHYRRVNVTSKKLVGALLNRNGGHELMKLTGWKHEDGHLVLDETALASLTDWVDWFHEQIAACIEMWTLRAPTDRADSACAECVVQLRLASGMTVLGGFSGVDTVADVLHFAQQLFKEETRDHVVLREPHRAQNIDFDRLGFTLAEAGWVPRATLVATTSTTPFAVALASRRAQAKDQQQIDRLKQEQLRQARAKEREAEHTLRERAILEFKADRERVSRRIIPAEDTRA